MNKLTLVESMLTVLRTVKNDNLPSLLHLVRGNKEFLSVIACETLLEGNLLVPGAEEYYAELIELIKPFAEDMNFTAKVRYGLIGGMFDKPL